MRRLLFQRVLLKVVIALFGKIMVFGFFKGIMLFTNEPIKMKSIIRLPYQLFLLMLDLKINLSEISKRMLQQSKTIKSIVYTCKVEIVRLLHLKIIKMRNL